MADDATPTAAVCQFVGDPMPDIAGIGILVGFSGQAFLSLCLALWVFFFSRHGRLDMLHEDGSDEHAIEIKRLEMVQDILMIGNDIQVMTGIALMITVFSSYNKMDIYHFRLIYDIVSFVGVSVAAALVCFTFCLARRESYRRRRQRRATGLPDEDEDEKQRQQRHCFACMSPIEMLHGWAKGIKKTLPNLHKLDKSNPVIKKFTMSGRYRATYVFAAFFLAMTVMLNEKLGRWNLDEPGYCYNTAYTSAPGAKHPQADRVYVWTTFGWMMSVMMFSVYDGATHRRYILLAAFLQFPLHFYMMIALRTANQGLLGVTAEENNSTEASDIAAMDGDSDNSENDWDFGQTTAVLLLTVAFIEAFIKGLEFYRFERDIKKKRAAKERKRGPINDDEQDERDLAAFHVVTSATSKSTSNMALSRLHPWKHKMPSPQHTDTEGGNERILKRPDTR
ncbi:hypothetical protein SEUCBS140593_008782 [Sporothrix eucalyptigena]|uniref:Uncharacterized protein n=1 Tax=Sporothrix eucalyptigena TaxID=1812306 RepID=A0ABP0CPC3_9PEZI